MKYTVIALSNKGLRKYEANSLDRAQSKASAWVSHGWRRVAIHDNEGGRFIFG